MTLQFRLLAMTRWTSAALLMTFPTLLIFEIAAGMQGRKLKENRSTWVRVAPAGKEFAVWMPASPREGSETLIINQQPVTLHYYGLSEGGTVYAVLSVSGLENKLPDLAHSLMLHLYGKLIPTSLLDESGGNAVGVIATHRGDIRLDGYTGQEYHIQARNRSGLWRFYSTGKKFYAVVASTTPKDDALINRFINSFALASPPPAVSQTEPSQPPLKASPERALPAPSSKESWLVILRTFSKSERLKANQRLSILRGFGYDAHIVETDHYPKLKRGFLAVVLGPYSQSVAKSISDRVHSVAPGAYIKSGW